MNSDRHSQAEQKELIDDPIERARREAENGLRQYELMLDTIRAHVDGEKKFELRQSLVLKLQNAALEGIHPLAGTYRNTPVHISGSKHAPPEPFSVAEEVGKLCDYVNSNWEKDAVHLAAYILWKLNWIHPFSDGNGRTARAVSYLVLSIRLNALLPGTPTIPEQISVDKGPYYDALEIADSAWYQDEKIDVTSLEEMLSEMLRRQLLGLAALSDSAKQNLERIVHQRVLRGSKEMRRSSFGTEEVASQLWAIADYLVLQLGTPEELQASERRQKKYGSPFPKLFALEDVEASYLLAASGSSNVFVGTKIDVTKKYGIRLHRDAGVLFNNILVLDEGAIESWTVIGSLLAVRLGDSVTPENFYKTFDFLLATQLAKA